MSESKVFRHYLLRNLIVLSIVVLGMLPFFFVTHKTIQRSAIKQSISKIESGMTGLKNNLDKMYIISTIIRDNQYLNELRQIKGEIPQHKFLYQKYLRDQLRYIHHIYDYSPMLFVMFRNNNIFVSNSQVSYNFDDYYGVFFNVSGMDFEEFRKYIFSSEYNSYLVSEDLTYCGDKEIVQIQNAILYIMSLQSVEFISSPEAAVIFILEEDVLLKTLLTDDCIEKGFIRIMDNSNNIILNHGEDVDVLDSGIVGEKVKYKGSEYLIFTYTQPLSGLTATVGYPLELVNNELIDIVKVLILYAIIGLAFAFLLAMGFAFHWYQPVRRVLQILPKEEEKEIPKKAYNEYDYIRESFIRLISDKDEYQAKLLLVNAQKQAIMMENLFIRGIYTKDEQKELEKCFVKPLRFFCVCYMHIDVSEANKDREVASLYALELLKENYLNPFIHIHSTLNTELFLFQLESNDPEQLDNIRKAFNLVASLMAEDMETVCNVGISSIANNIENINICYYQARQTMQAYKSDHANSVEIYKYIKGQDGNFFNNEFINRLYNLVLCGDRDAISKEFNVTKSHCLKHYQQYEIYKPEIFYTIRHIIFCAYMELAFIPRQDIELPQYQQNATLKECFDLLERSIYDLCDRIEENRRSKNIELREKIIKYLENNFTRPELTAGIVCSEIGISEKYLYAFLKEQTGKTFAAYIEEQRINKAKECLTGTDWSNEKIAEVSGFGAINTFYRSFKKHTGMPPSVYRKNKIEM